MANIRAAYAEAVSENLTTGTSASKKVTLTQSTEGWQSDVDFPENLKPTEVATNPIKGKEVTITATETGATIDIVLTKKGS